MRFLEIGRLSSDNGHEIIIDLNYVDRENVTKPHAIDLQIGDSFATLNPNKVKELIKYLENASKELA